MATETRRNDPCTCGSGAKYKNCCEHKTSWRNNKILTGVGVALILIVGALLVGRAFSGGGSDRPDCPPGQVWSEQHGHCH